MEEKSLAKVCTLQSMIQRKGNNLKSYSNCNPKVQKSSPLKVGQYREYTTRHYAMKKGKEII